MTGRNGVSFLERIVRSASRQPRLPEGTRLYAVGDIHGHSDLLASILARIDSDLRQRPVERSMLVTLGDYIDRGPDSRGTIDLLLARSAVQETVFLKGNHETFVFDFGKDASIMRHWLKFGALETMASYGHAASADMSARELQDLSEAWIANLPAAHAEFYARLALSFTCGDYFFAHAGIKPGVALSKQVERDLIWIRDEFLQSEERFEKLVVHGHTPVPEPDFRPNRINIDTGAYATGRLTCLVLEGTDRTIL
jgi:serine/threonine protein phosphatase 1